MTYTSRRTFLRQGAAIGGLAVAGSLVLDTRASAAVPSLRDFPFKLGVASGDPAADGFVIWTRLALEPVAADGLGGMPNATYPVSWQVATDDRFSNVVREGVEMASLDAVHSVHVELFGLEPDREYWYRFKVQQHVSPAGRALTTPERGKVPPGGLSMAFVSCSNFPAGYFTAYRRLAEDQPDLVLHLGDYQYEGAGNGVGRAHAGPETTTLAGYRQRHAQYKSDLDLQAAHAVAPWLVVWDDHEVDNNYADDIADRAVERPGFIDRRAAAYRAYYENMPLRRTSIPSGPDLQLFRRIHWGELATFHMLDTRQYRSDQACNDGYKDCAAADDPTRSLPGFEQEEWLLNGFRESNARWDLLGQQVFFGRRDNNPTATTTVSMDAWDGYRASRDRITRGWIDAGVRNPVVLTGDVHAHWASDLYLDYDNPDRPVGSELITSSITSGGNGYDQVDGQHPWSAWNPNIRFWTNLRGYVNTKITPTELTARYRCVEHVTTPGADVFTRATFVIEDQVRGLQQVSKETLQDRGKPLRTPSKDRIEQDTVREETGYELGNRAEE